MRRTQPIAFAANLSIAAVAAAVMLVLSGCAAVGLESQAPAVASTSVEKLEYYQYQVKGYQNSFPHPIDPGPDIDRQPRFLAGGHARSRAARRQSRDRDFARPERTDRATSL